MNFRCVTELDLKISEIKLTAKLAKTILDGPEIGNVLGEMAEAPCRRSTANTMTKAALVLLTGYFEGFLKKLIEEFVGELNDLELPLNLAGDELLLSVLQHSIGVDRAKTMPKAMELKSCIAGDGHYPLMLETAGKTGGNPSVDNVESLFLRLGIPEIIDKLSVRDFSLDNTYVTVSHSQQLQRHIEAALGGDLASSQKIFEIIDNKWTPKKQRRDVGYVGVIQELLKKRNKIAHGENWGEQVTPAELSGFCDQIIKLCSGIAEFLYDELNSYKQKIA
ncbi:hypothetical protein HU751_019715 [Pseudomonas sp. BW13M1]|uniref:RiboL-PSP-HEPN domain-containing protein n=1 Tax=Pseudomonas peradeniyensis TaxID=2745488 RepID=A0A923G9S0_9PSED|nr:MAE_28990/MAE_18760 family HEPN-like nuclease [Pseudomonas peradeniyensis]MBV4507061.1 hypothetical protein [Pseudomonas peradeniyensis]